MNDYETKLQELRDKLEELKRMAEASAIDATHDKYRLVKHGTWTDCRCSVCGTEAITAWTETGGAWIFTPYCPWCGSELTYTPKHYEEGDDVEL